MRRIHKRSQEPPALLAYRKTADPNRSYAAFPSKDELREPLLEDQGSLCCYCMRRIDVRDMKIEHYRSQHRHPEHALDWRNLLAACNGREGQPHGSQTCDTRKGDEDLVLDPRTDGVRVIRYLGSGRLVVDDPDHVDDIERRLNLNATELRQARAQAIDNLERLMSLLLLGDIETETGNLKSARSRCEKGLAIAEKLAKADSHSAQAKRDLSVSLERLGDVELEAGNLSAASDLFERSLKVAEELATTDPHSAQAKRDLSVSPDNPVGHVVFLWNGPTEARDVVQRSLKPHEELAKADSHSAQANRDLFVSLIKLGDAALQPGNLMKARDLFERSLRVAEELAKADPHSAQAKRDISVSLAKLGDVELGAGNLMAARDLFERSLMLVEELAKADPHNARAKRDVSLSLDRLGDVEMQAGNLAAARDLLQRSLKAREELAKADPHSTWAKRELPLSLDNLGDVEVQAGNLAAARDLFERSLEIREELAKADSHNAKAKYDLLVSLERLRDVEVQAGNLTAVGPRELSGVTSRSLARAPTTMAFLAVALPLIVPYPSARSVGSIGDGPSAASTEISHCARLGTRVASLPAAIADVTGTVLVVSSSACEYDPYAPTSAQSSGPSTVNPWEWLVTTVPFEAKLLEISSPMTSLGVTSYANSMASGATPAHCRGVPPSLSLATPLPINVPATWVAWVVTPMMSSPFETREPPSVPPKSG